MKLDYDFSNETSKKPLQRFEVPLGARWVLKVCFFGKINALSQKYADRFSMQANSLLLELIAVILR
jgi:hypothetical protein